MVFSGVCVIRSLVLCVCFADSCLSFSTFSFGHCVVCSSSIYGFWLPLWYLQCNIERFNIENNWFQNTRIIHWLRFRTVPCSPDHLSSPMVFSGVCVIRSLVLCVCFADSCLSFSTIGFKIHVLYIGYGLELFHVDSWYYNKNKNPLNSFSNLFVI
jgi:hypothetical protein